MSNQTEEDRQIQTLLSTISQDRTKTFSARETLFERMVAEYRATQRDSQLETEPDSDEVAHLVEWSNTHRSQTAANRKLPLALTAAAVLALALVGGWWMTRSGDSNSEQDVSVADGGTLEESGVQPDGTIRSGAFSTDSVGGGISFVAPAGLELLVDQPGEIVLGREGDPGENRAAWTVRDSPDSLVTVLTELRDDQMLEPEQYNQSTATGTVLSWRVLLTADALDTYGCEPIGPCIELDGGTFWSGRTNYVTEFVSDDGRRVWWFGHVARLSDPLLPLTRQVLSTVTFNR